jgi:hypothetical protein
MILRMPVLNLDVAVKSRRLLSTLDTNGVFVAPPVIHGCSSTSAAVRRFAVSLVRSFAIRSFAVSLQTMSWTRGETQMSKTSARRQASAQSRFSRFLFSSPPGSAPCSPSWWSGRIQPG